MSPQNGGLTVEEALAFFAKGQSYVGHSTEARHGFVLASALRESREEAGKLREALGSVECCVAECRNDCSNCDIKKSVADPVEGGK